MNRIYTRSGDEGTTGIHGGVRVPKTCRRIEANGALDELNTAIGILRAHLLSDDPYHAELKQIQMNLMAMMSIVATPDKKRGENVNTVADDVVLQMEQAIDDINAKYSGADYFILPGGSPASAFAHQARVTARRAERELWRLNEEDPVPPVILTYINRLSDYFFVLARRLMEIAGLDEERWNLFTYKRKR